MRAAVRRPAGRQTVRDAERQWSGARAGSGEFGSRMGVTAVTRRTRTTLRRRNAVRQDHRTAVALKMRSSWMETVALNRRSNRMTAAARKRRSLRMTAVLQKMMMTLSTGSRWKTTAPRKGR